MNKREKIHTPLREKERIHSTFVQERTIKYDESESNEETEGKKERERETNSYAVETQF